jgi:hypothetical protein
MFGFRDGSLKRIKHLKKDISAEITFFFQILKNGSTYVTHMKNFITHIHYVTQIWTF